MSSRLFIIITLLFFSSSAIAKGGEKSKSKVLKIQVVDAETGEPIPGAKITLEGFEKFAYSDFDGFYEVNVARDHKASFHIEAISYLSCAKVVERFNKSRTYTIELVRS